MFCPKCGSENQSVNSYCRKCGFFLPDFENLKTKETSPEQHFLANTVLSALTGLISLGLAITLYSIFLEKENTPMVIYITAGFLTAMFFWQVQILWRNLLLRKKFLKKPNIAQKVEESKQETNYVGENITNKLLSEPDERNIVPPSITDSTTKSLKQKVKSSQS